MGIGEAAGLFAASLWALSSIFYSRAKMTAWEMNFWKNIIATGVFFAQLWIVKSLGSQTVFEAPIEAWCWLAGSSVIGILIGDTVYFRSVQILGPRRALVVATASPIFGVIVGYFFMGDTISLILMFGIGLTILGVGIVVGDKQAEIENPNIYPGKFVQGVLFGIGGALCQAVGVGAAKVGMAHGCEALESSFIRMFTASIAGIYLVSINPYRYAYSKVAMEPTDEKHLIDKKHTPKRGEQIRSRKRNSPSEASIDPNSTLRYPYDEVFYSCFFDWNVARNLVLSDGPAILRHCSSNDTQFDLPHIRHSLCLVTAGPSPLDQRICWDSDSRVRNLVRCRILADCGSFQPLVTAIITPSINAGFEYSNSKRRYLNGQQSRVLLCLKVT